MPRKLDVRQLQAKVTNDPHSPLFAQLADAYRMGGKFEEAIRVCEEGLKHRPNYPGAYIVLGRAHHESGDLLAAREAFQRVTQLAPDNVLAHGFLGQIAEARNETLEALETYRMALTLYPFDKQIRAAVVRLEAHVGDEAQPASPVALEDQAAAREPLASATLAELYAGQGFYERAAEVYERLTADAPGRADLQAKYREVTTHLRRAPEAGAPTSAAGRDALRLLEAWRDAFRRLRPERQGGVELLEAYQTAFQKLRARPRGPITVLEAWRDAFRRLKAAAGGEAT